MRSHLLTFIALLIASNSMQTLAEPHTLPLLSRPISFDWKVDISDDDRLWIRSKGELILAVGNDLPPFDLTTSGRDYEGLTADVAGLVSRLLDVPLRVRRFTDRELAMQAVLQGEADLLSTSNDLEAENPRLVLTQPYVSDRPALVTRLDEQRELPANLGGMRIAISQEYLSPRRVQAIYPLASVHSYPTPDSAMRAVAMGKSDVYLGDMISSNYLINQTFSNHLRITRFGGMVSQGFGFMLRKEDTRLLRMLNTLFSRFLQSHRSSLMKRWSGGNTPALLEPELPLTSAEQTWLEQHPVVRVATYGNYTPVTFFDSEGNYHGITADVLEQVRLRTGLHFEIVRTASMDGMLDDLKSGQADMIGALSPRMTLEKTVSFTRPYMSVSFVTVTPRQPEAAARLEALAGKRVAVTRGYILLDFLRRTYPQVQLVEVDSLLDALALTARGGADGAVMSGNVAEYYVHRMFSDKLRISELIDVPEEFIGFAVRRENHELVSILDKALVGIPPDELAVLVNQRWRSNVEVSGQSWRDYLQIIYQVVMISSLLLLVSLLWNAYLRRQIKLRIQAQHALNDQLQFMEALINGTPHPIYVRDLKGNLLLCNENYLQTLGLERQPLIGQALPEQILDNPADAEQLRKDYRQVIEEGLSLQNDRQLNVRGQQLTLYHWLLPYRDFRGKVKGVIGGWIDISERRRLVDALQEAKERADEASRAKSTFLTTMSHEIRTPMNAVIGMLELALKRAEQGQLDTPAIQLAYGSAKNLLELIGDILDIARIESGRLSLTPVQANLRDLVESVVRVFDGVAHQKGLELLLAFDDRIDCDVQIDPMRFKQILSNLVSNAIKFTESGSVSIRVTGSSGQERRLALRLEVEDSGIGIGEADLQRLFQPFVQASNNDPNINRGAGLGLVISRTLCEMMGGTLSMHSKLGHGTQVTLTLDLVQLDEGLPIAPPTPGITRLRQRPLDVLVVDDHAANRELLRQQLSFLGHRITSAQHGAEGLEIWRRERFDVVISDCHMPVMGGYALTRRIREQEQAEGRHRCRVLGYTANAQSEEFQRCLEAGMDACLFKPASLKALEVQLAEATGLPPAEPGLLRCDLGELDLLTGGNPVLNSRLINEILQANREDLDQLRALTGQQDWQGIAGLAHKIKGAAKIIKARHLIDSCQRLESLCQTPAPLASLREGVERVEDAFEQLEQTLRPNQA
ncbi:transporter substrate-binding domain-containing protein [Pseudomonas sp. DB1]|uniref:histidine kinase n=2 Tax=Metapseudomonas boanensis TaxID=2822138 RepID=A0ABS5XKM5_9GAMM|nr:transporter substrate-binding domain-containing protein [Pseudomonas boanensis]